MEKGIREMPYILKIAEIFADKAEIISRIAERPELYAGEDKISINILGEKENAAAPQLLADGKYNSLSEILKIVSVFSELMERERNAENTSATEKNKIFNIENSFLEEKGGFYKLHESVFNGRYAENAAETKYAENIFNDSYESILRTAADEKNDHFRSLYEKYEKVFASSVSAKNERNNAYLEYIEKISDKDKVYNTEAADRYRDTESLYLDRSSREREVYKNIFGEKNSTAESRRELIDRCFENLSRTSQSEFFNTQRENLSSEKTAAYSDTEKNILSESTGFYVFDKGTSSYEAYNEMLKNKEIYDRINNVSEFESSEKEISGEKIEVIFEAGSIENSFSSAADMDEIVNEFAQRLQEAICSAAEGCL